MRITEIEKIPKSAYPGGKHYLIYNRKDLKGLQLLPGGSRLQYNIVGGARTPTVQIWDPAGPDAKPNNPQMIGELRLDSVETEFPMMGSLAVNSITVDEDYRGQGIAKSLYGIVLSIMKRPLVSGSTQTPGGRRNWLSLGNIPGVQVHGYLNIRDDKINDQEIDIIMGKIGAQYLGDKKKYGRTRRFFSFDVRSADNKAELASVVKTRLSKLYNQDYNIETGLYAVWGGK